MINKSANRGLINKSGLLVAASFAAIVTATAPAHADEQAASGSVSASGGTDSNTGIQEIVVTARKRAEKLQDVPVSITAFTATDIQREGISDLADVARMTPGLIFDRGISQQDTRPSIRGLPATRGKPPVGILVDGIDISSQAVSTSGGGNLLNLRLLDLDRIEVVKGPQSALYGRSAFAGAINYITRRPAQDFEVDLRGDFGSYGKAEVAGSVSGPITDKFALRADFSYAGYDGDAKNAVTKGELEGYQEKGAGLSFEFRPSDVLDIYGHASYSTEQDDQPALVTLGGFTGTAAIPGGAALTAVNKGIAGGVFAAGTQPSYVATQGTLAYSGSPQYSVNPVTGKDFPGSTADTVLSNLNIDWDLGFATLSSLTGVTHQHNVQDYDGDFYGVAPAQLIGGVSEPLKVFDHVLLHNDYTQVSEEVRLGTLGTQDRFRWAAGAMYWTSDTSQTSGSLESFDGFGLPVTTPLYFLSAAQLDAKSIPFSTPRDRENDSYSGYGVLEYDIMPDLTVSAEGRYLIEKSHVKIALEPTAVFAPITSYTPVTTSGSTNDNAFVPRFSADYHWTQNVMAYASIAEGFKPGGINELNIGSSIPDSTYKAETLWNYETGVKTNWLNNTVFFNAAGFFMDWTNKQVNALTPDSTQASGYRTVVSNAGGAEVYGLDIDGTWRPAFVKGLSLNGAYTYLDTKYTNYTYTTTSALTVTEARQCQVLVSGGKSACFISLNGHQLERAPKHSLAATASYTIPINANLDGLVEISAQYMTKRYLEDFNNYILPAHTNVDMRIGVIAPKWSAILYGTNILSSNKVTNAQENFDLSTFGETVNIYKPTPAQFGIRLTAKY